MIRQKMPGVVLAAALLSACPDAQDRTAASGDPASAAERIALENIIVDTHIDVPYRLQVKMADVSKATDGGDFDYPRAVAGGLNAPFMSIYTPATLEAEGRSREVAEALIDMVEAIARSAPDKFAIALSTEDVRRHKREGIISLPMGMENGSPLEGDLASLQHFYDRGIRYITLAHGLSNHLSDSSYDDNRQWNGLSEFGAEAVREMNRLGIMVDISHISDDAFWQVMDISAVPVIASHSSARHFTPGFERNMSDEMIRRLANDGGVIMINFGSSFITQEARDYSTARKEASEAYKIEHPDAGAADVQADFHPLYAERNGTYPYALTDDVLDHIDHVVKLAGVDHVGIGSDYDGVGDSLPVGLKDVASYPNLIEGLLGRGYSESEIRRILGENLLRVWAEIEAYASRQQ